jgi:hypothetical protein
MLTLFALPVGAQDTNTTDDGNETVEGNETTGEPPDDTTGGAPSASGEFGLPADTPQPDEGGIVRVLTIGVLEEGTCADGQLGPCWDVSTLAANPGDVVVLHANLRNSENFHNLHLSEESPIAVASPGPKTQAAGAGLHTVALKVPASGHLEFLCDLHPQTMIGNIVTPAEAGAAAGHASVPGLGVNFLAYWVGVIAFAILFIVYGATFFLFKYNETPATTDQWDRAEPGAQNKVLRDRAFLLAIAIAAVVIAAVLITKYAGNIDVLKTELTAANTQIDSLSSELARLRESG